jgi:hypothetical protein
MAAVGDGSASETVKEYSHHFIMLCFRSRDSIVELDENFTCLLYVLDGRATLVTGRMVVGAEELDSSEIHDISIADDTRQELRAGDVVNTSSLQYPYLNFQGFVDRAMTPRLERLE